jgi:ABC-type lipoprotein release transport system permease subunit
MLKNFITIAVRHLLRHKLFSLINIICLAIGISFSLIICVYIIQEKSVDRNLRNLDHHFVIKSNWKVKDKGMDITTLGPLAKTMKDDYPNLVSNYYRYNPVATVLSTGNKYINGVIAIGDTSLVTMYGFPVLYGNPEKAFINNQSAVITESIAQKLFGRKDVLNQPITMQTAYNGKRQQYQVSAVLKDIPHNSVTGLIGIDYEVFVPTIGNEFYGGGDPADGWTSVYELGFIELKPGVRPKDLEMPFRSTLKKYAPADIYESLKVELAPVKDYYMESNLGAHSKMIMALSSIAVFILIMAIFNFINISIGTSSYRLREIGLRKVFGSLKKQLIVQYFTESMVMVLMAAILGLGAYQALIPMFNQMLNTTLLPVFGFTIMHWSLIILMIIGVGLLAGFYPAVFLSRSKIVQSIQGKFQRADSGNNLRKILLVIQFSLATIIFICALNVSRQVNYFFHSDLGYDRDHVLVISAYPKQWDSAGVARMKSIKQQLLTMPTVKSASICFEIPERKPPSSVDMRAENTSGSEAINIPVTVADEDYSRAFGLNLAEGQFFRPEYEGFTRNEVILNESAVKALGLEPGRTIGQKIMVPSSKTELTVRGVIKNYHYGSLQEGIGPMAILRMQDLLQYRYIILKLNQGNLAKNLEEIAKKWSKLSPEAPFEWFFMDDRFNRLYRAELQLQQATWVATIQNLLIVLMGIFGLVAFSIARRNREMAVRKVLGARLSNIIWLFLIDYAGIIALSNLIAWPLAYMITKQWLEQYAYRINPNMSSFLIPGLTILGLSVLLIAIQCFKEAGANPVLALRAE